MCVVRFRAVDRLTRAIDFAAIHDYYGHMQKTSVANLKARLSEFLAAVRRGEDVIITDRGQPIARLTALDQSEGMDARVAELVRAGVIRPPRQRLPKDFRTQPRGADVGGSVLRALLDEREAGW